MMTNVHLWVDHEGKNEWHTIVSSNINLQLEQCATCSQESFVMRSISSLLVFFMVHILYICRAFGSTWAQPELRHNCIYQHIQNWEPVRYLLFTPCYPSLYSSILQSDIVVGPLFFCLKIKYITVVNMLQVSYMFWIWLCTDKAMSLWM